MGLGVDLVEVPRFERVLARHRQRLLARVFTAAERAYAAERRRGGESLAVRFAAKCAARRALGGGGAGAASGFRAVLLEIEIVREPGRAPTLRFHGETARRAAAAGVARVALTLTHDHSVCLAQVVLEDAR